MRAFSLPCSSVVEQNETEAKAKGVSLSIGSSPVTATNSFLHLHFDLDAEPGMTCKPSLPIRIQLITSFRFSKFKSSDDGERWVTPPAPFFHESSANGKDNHSNQNKALWNQSTDIRQTRSST